MRKSLYLSKITFLALFLAAFCFSAQAQQTFQLDPPGKYKSYNQISIGGGNYDPGDIAFGSVPAGSSSKPVLVFIHGYTGTADTWLTDNDMYTKAYNAGYRTAFATVHPDKSMWVNGQMFSSQLNVITAHFGVNKVVVIAHSKGGVDTDAALVHYGAHAKVKTVISLGTPHYGTPLADLAQSGWVWWLSAIFGQRNDATYVLQSGYMDYYRSISDNKPENNYTDFRTLGGWDYSGVLWFSGVYLEANGGGKSAGGNDGVVIYNDAKRPRGVEMFTGYGDSRTKINHFDLTQGGKTWNYIQAQLPSALSRMAGVEGEVYEGEDNPNAVVRSNSIIVTSSGGTAYFPIEEGVQKVSVDIRQQDFNKKADIILPKGMKQDQVTRQRKQPSQDQLIGRYSSQITVDKPVGGAYAVEGEGAYVAVVTVEGGGFAELTSDLNDVKRVYETGEAMHFSVKLVDANNQPIRNAAVKGYLRLTTNLEGTAIGEEPVEVTFKETEEAGVYTYATAPLVTSGIYNISVKAEKENFARSIVHSVAVVEGANTIAPSKENPFALQAYPNPFNEQVKIQFTIEESQPVRLLIRDITGRTVFSKTFANQPAGSYSVNWNAKNEQGGKVAPGTYLYQMIGAKEKQTGRLILID